MSMAQSLGISQNAITSWPMRTAYTFQQLIWFHGHIWETYKLAERRGSMAAMWSTSMFHNTSIWQSQNSWTLRATIRSSPCAYLIESRSWRNCHDNTWSTSSTPRSVASLKNGLTCEWTKDMRSSRKKETNILKWTTRPLQSTKRAKPSALAMVKCISSSKSLPNQEEPRPRSKRQSCRRLPRRWRSRSSWRDLLRWKSS